MDEIVSVLISFGLATLGGFIAGYALRKIVKIALIIVGAFIFGIIVLQGAGWVNADYDKMTNDTIKLVSDVSTNIVPQLNAFTNNFSIIILGGLSIGGIIGFVKAG